LTDPGNASRAFLRNRVRLDLLPAMRHAADGIEEALLDIARRSARWRTEVDDFVTEQVRPWRAGDGRVSVSAAELAGYDADSLCVIWGAIAARAGLALDQRGTRRLAAFTMKVPHEGVVTLSGGWYMEARRRVYILGKRSRVTTVPARLPLTGELQWGRFRFRVADASSGCDGTESWQASLSTVSPALVRAWQAGDRLGRSGGMGARRVKRYLSDAGVRGLDREGWPVVLGAEGDVVWIPGVRRADAATERSGRPVRHYICERITR